MNITCDQGSNQPNFIEDENEDLIMINELILNHQMAERADHQPEAGHLGGVIPSRDNFPGPFLFNSSFDESTSGQQWVYSQYLDQIFIGMNKTLLMQFRLNQDIWATRLESFFIVAMPVYCSDEHVNVPVCRCVFHSVEDDPQGQAHQTAEICLCNSFNRVGHVLRAGEGAEYLYDRKSRRHSVRVPLTPPQAGSDSITIPYTFSCKTSCAKGMQRRTIYVIFTLEDGLGTVYGRQKVKVKISSCPKRDKKRQEDDYRREADETGQGGGQKEAKRRRTEAPEPLTPRPRAAPLDISFFPTPIKDENVDPCLMQRNELLGELRDEIDKIYKLKEAMREMNQTIDNSFNRILELHQQLLISLYSA